jgi:hypothetical protein
MRPANAIQRGGCFRTADGGQPPLSPAPPTRPPRGPPHPPQGAPPLTPLGGPVPPVPPLKGAQARWAAPDPARGWAQFHSKLLTKQGARPSGALSSLSLVKPLSGPRHATGSRKHARCLACRIGRLFHSKLLAKQGVRPLRFHSKLYSGRGTDILPLKTSFASMGQTPPLHTKPFYERKARSDRPPAPPKKRPRISPEPPLFPLPSSTFSTSSTSR